MMISHAAFKCPTTLSNPVKNLIHRLLTVDRTKRFTAEDVAGHKWFTGEATFAKCLSPSTVNTRMNTSFGRKPYMPSKGSGCENQPHTIVRVDSSSSTSSESSLDDAMEI